MSISAFNKCICGTLVTTVSLLPVSFDASGAQLACGLAGTQTAFQETKGDAARSETWERQRACWSSHLDRGTPYNTLSSHFLYIQVLSTKVLQVRTSLFAIWQNFKIQS